MHGARGESAASPFSGLTRRLSRAGTAAALCPHVMIALCPHEFDACTDDACCAPLAGNDLPYAGNDLSLFEFAVRCLAECVEELRLYRIHVDPRLELRLADSQPCDDNPGGSEIHLALPDVSSPAGRLKAQRLGASLGCRSDHELMRLLFIMVPWLVAHELGHYLRRRYGRSGDDLWAEERVANRLASALTRHHLSPFHRAQVAFVLRRALDTHVAPVNADGVPTIGYHGVLLAMNASWQYLDLMHHGSEYVADFARVYLGVEVPLLPLIDDADEPRPEQVIACFRAYVELLPRSRAGARYFYRRYRELIWTMLSASGVAAFQPDRARCGTAFFLEGWASLESDPLGDLAGFAPAPLCALFPSQIALHPLFRLQIEAHLFPETDRRLFTHALRGMQNCCDDLDEAAAETLNRLALLDNIDIFASIPARSALEIARSLCPVRFAPGETMCWQGEPNDGVFCVVEGSADVLVEGHGGELHVGTLREGDVFGEVSFFHGDMCTATVRAEVASKCLVIKDTDLLRIARKHPSVLMHMGSALARRQGTVNRQFQRADDGEGPATEREPLPAS